MRIHKTLWPDRQDKRQVRYETFMNASSKPVRDRFHGCGTLASKEALGRQIEPTTIPFLWIAVIQKNSRAGAMFRRSTKISKRPC